MLCLGSDHGGFQLKEAIKKHLNDKKFVFEDMGTYTEKSVDYPVIAKMVCKKIVIEKSLGILICGTGIGISIAANKIKGIRAALCSDIHTAQMCRKHNNANVMCLGGRVLNKDLALDMVDAFLSEKFEKGRHLRRLDQISELENI